MNIEKYTAKLLDAPCKSLERLDEVYVSSSPFPGDMEQEMVEVAGTDTGLDSRVLDLD